MHPYTRLTLELRDGVAWVTLNRPEVRNAFDAALIGELEAAFGAVAADAAVRVAVLAGAGATFCAGADAAWMQASIGLDAAANQADAEALAAMYRAVDECPCPVIGRVHGAAMGGGAGLVACCDVVVAEAGTRFAFSEVRLGIVPAVISPFVLAKIGAGAARRWFVTGERFGAEQAAALGLVHEVAPGGELDRRVDALLAELAACGPRAMREAKALIRAVGAARSRAEAVAHAARTIARVRTSPEGQEGLRAFLEKRAPKWS